MFVLGADLTLVDSLVDGANILDDQGPLVRPLVVIRVDPGVWSEGEKADRQWMHVVVFLPGHLYIWNMLE